RAIVCSVECVRHVRKYVQILSRSIALAVNVGRRGEEKRLRYIEVEIESLRTFGAISRETRRTVVDDAVPVVVLACRNVVPVGTTQSHRTGQKDSHRKPGVH